MSIDFDTPGTDDDQPDWLTDSMGGDIDIDGDGGGGGGGNRLFVIIAIGLAGLIVLGLFAVGGLLVIRRAQSTQELAQITPETPAPIVVDEVVPTATFTPTPLPPTPTDTPTIAPTNTRVVQQPSDTNGQAGSGEAGDAAGGVDVAGAGTQATNTPAPTQTPVPVATSADGGEVPNTGFGGFEAGLLAIGLVIVLLASRRLRHAA